MCIVDGGRIGWQWLTKSSPGAVALLLLLLLTARGSPCQTEQTPTNLSLSYTKKFPTRN